MNIDGKPGQPKLVMIIERGRHVSYIWDENCTQSLPEFMKEVNSSVTGINELEVYLQFPFEGKYKKKFFYKSFGHRYLKNWTLLVDEFPVFNPLYIPTQGYIATPKTNIDILLERVR